MDVTQIIVDGVLLGGIYALLGIPLNLLFGTTRIIHFAYGEFLMLGMYGALILFRHTGLDPYEGGVLVMVPVFVLIGVAAYWLLFRWIAEKPYTIQIIATLGFGIALSNLALMVESANVQTVRTAVSGSSVEVLGVLLPTTRLIGFGGALLIALLLAAFLRYSFWGSGMRALTQSKLGAEVVGIPVPRVHQVAVVVTTVLTGVSGALLLPIFTVFPTVGADFAVIAFVVVVLGGMGSIYGGLIAAAVIGLVQSFSAATLGVHWETVSYFLIFILVLLVRPAGIAGKRGTELLGHE